jgi:polysaccharide pyruvyl transferase WcaK-like protein
MADAILSGYYGQRNAGDDAFLVICAWHARRHFGIDRIYATAPPSRLMRKLVVRPIYHRFPDHGILNYALAGWKARKVDSIIFGGGSIFHSLEGIERATKWVRGAGPGRHFAVGVSIGPFDNAEAEAACASLLTKLDFIGVRDRISYRRGRALAPAARVELTFDLAPLLLEMIEGDLLDRTSPRRGVGVALRSFEQLLGGQRDRAESRIEIIADAIRRCAARRMIEEIVLIDFNGHKRRGDHRVHQDLKDRLQSCTRIRHVHYTDNPIDTMRVVASLRAIIAMRLHAAIFGFCTHTPVLMLAYHEKCREWAGMIGLPNALRADALKSTTRDLAESIEWLLGESVLAPTLPLETAVQAAMKNWKWSEAAVM